MVSSVVYIPEKRVTDSAQRVTKESRNDADSLRRVTKTKMKRERNQVNVTGAHRSSFKSDTDVVNAENIGPIPSTTSADNESCHSNSFSVSEPSEMPHSESSDHLEDAVSTDPYMLADSALCKAALNDNRWTNKQRTLVFSSRGVSHRQRHFLEDLKKLLPHSKSEPKWEKKASLSEINEICEMHSCNNCIFLETRKSTELYMWLAKTPMGPSARFQVLNVHTLGELRMTGNCLLHSRPFLVFDRAFTYNPELRLMREMFIQAFGTPRNHTKAKPFYDHVFSFFYHDHKIWFRHYQISPATERDANKPLRQTLTEIGPRFVLDPIKIFDGSFSGGVIYQNPHYLSPTSIRVLASQGIGSKYAARKASGQSRKIRRAATVVPKDFLTRTNVFAENHRSAQPPRGTVEKMSDVKP